MRICAISNSYRAYSYKPNFKSTGKADIYQDGSIRMRNYSYVFRNDLDWLGLAKFMDKNFEKKDKVNVLNCACSDGSEPYTLAIALKECIPDKNRLKKFLPIIASDVDLDILDFAKSGRINLHYADIPVIDEKTNHKRAKYFRKSGLALEIPNDGITSYCNSYEVSPYLKSAVQFKQSDLIHEILSLKDDGNSVVLMRNVTPYLEPDYLELVIEILKNKLKQGSVVVFGEYDETTQIEKDLAPEFEVVQEHVLRKKN